MSWNEWKINFQIFIFWVKKIFLFFLRILYKKFFKKSTWKMKQFIENIFYGGGLGPSNPPPGLHLCNPHAFWLRTLAWLISVWIRFAKTSVSVSFRFAKISQSSSWLWMSNTKSTISQKLKVAQKIIMST